MTSRKLNQSGQEIDLKAMKVGAKAYFYKPPTIQDVERIGRKAKHLNHCVGPGTIKEIIGDRNFVIEHTNPRTGKCHEHQRDAGMVLLKKPDPEASDPSNVVRATSRPFKHKKGTIPREGEFIITNCVPGANTWHVAQVTEVLSDKIEVNYYSTQGQSLDSRVQ
jgi:hypothetical protein